MGLHRIGSRTSSLLFLHLPLPSTTPSLRSSSYSSPVRVRFAPSPTGSLHIGGLRTALLNYLFAKSSSGNFILRIEDTDRSRYISNAESELTSMLQWSGLRPDEGPVEGGAFGPYRQSERLHIYKEVALELIATKKAYYCFCSERRLELLRRECAKNRTSFKYDGKCRNLSESEVQARLEEGLQKPTIRLRLEPNDSVFSKGHDDLVLGQVEPHNSFVVEGDPILMKSDGYPTYHMANVVDDHMMGITHVLRGIEWCSSTPKHRALYKALNWPEPKYGHLPLMLNEDGSKLSKRNTNELTLKKLKEKGYEPEVIMNFVTLTGGGFMHTDKDNNNMLYDVEELTKKFTLDFISHQSSRINLNRLDELNRLALKKRLNRGHYEELTSQLRRLLKSRFSERRNDGVVVDDYNDSFLIKVIEIHCDRIYTLNELLDIDYLWTRPTVDFKEIKSILSNSDEKRAKEVVEELDKFFGEEIHAQNASDELKKLSKKLKLSFKQVMQVCRLIITGDIQGSPIKELLLLFGNQEVANRIHCVRMTSLDSPH